MSEKFQNKYRVPSARHPNWDYRNNGAYFITICTKDKQHYFGKIETGIMQLNDMGKMAEQYWFEIPNHFPMVELGNFVVMPNHIHGVLMIDNADTDTGRDKALPCLYDNNKTIAQKRFQNQGKNSVSSIVGSYKSVVTKNIRLHLHAEFEWQSRFHDHIIRDNQSFERIQNYILNNPKNWDNVETRQCHASTL